MYDLAVLRRDINAWLVIGSYDSKEEAHIAALEYSDGSISDMTFAVGKPGQFHYDHQFTIHGVCIDDN